MVPILPEPLETRPVRLEKKVDVLPLVNVEQDSAGSAWELDANSLTAPQNRSQLRLSMVVPEEYTFSAVVELPASHQGDYALNIGLVADSAYFEFCIEQLATRDSTWSMESDGTRMKRDGRDH